MLVCDADEAADAMRSVAENLIRASMSSVDIWRAIERLEAQGWNEQAIADALALPVRTVRRLKLLAHLHPAMLDVMALGSMPNEEQLRTIAAATREEQAQVWKKHKPKKGQTDVAWYEVARALAKRRMPASAAKFGDDLAKAYGIVWEDDLFAPPGEDSRYTTNVEGFFGAQQEWLQNNLPERGTLLPVDEYGRGQLPKKAERVYGKPGKADLVGHYIDARTGEVETVAYRLPEPKKAGKPADGGKTTAGATGGGGGDDDDDADRADPAGRDAERHRHDRRPAHRCAASGARRHADRGRHPARPADPRLRRRQRHRRQRQRPARRRPPGDLPRDHRRRRADGRPRSAAPGRAQDADRRAVVPGEPLAERAVRPDRRRGDRRLAAAAEHGDRRVPVVPVARRAGDRRQGRGRHIEPRAKDTRARMVTRFKDGTFVYPGALFRLTPEEQAAAAERRHGRHGAGWVGPATGEDGDADGAEGTEDGSDATTVPTTAARGRLTPKPRLPWPSAGAGALSPEDTVMTHLSPDGGAMPPPSSSLSRPAPARPPPGVHPFCGAALLTLQIEFRRTRLAELEAEMIAACEAAALGTARRKAPNPTASTGTGRPGIAISPPPCGWRRPTARACAACGGKSASSNG